MTLRRSFLHVANLALLAAQLPVDDAEEEAEEEHEEAEHYEHRAHHLRRRAHGLQFGNGNLHYRVVHQVLHYLSLISKQKFHLKRNP